MAAVVSRGFLPIAAVILCYFSLQLGYTFGIPLHASCKVLYTFNLPCKQVSTSLLRAAESLKGPDGCKPGGEKCNYQVVFSNDTMLTGTHTTPVKHFVDEFSFVLSNPVGTTDRCIVDAKSRSQTWYAFLDYGTNYCNLRNLVLQASLEKSPGFDEKTSNSICTQYSSANCDVY
eukprot:scpid96995/ scgid31572/ 